MGKKAGAARRSARSRRRRRTGDDDEFSELGWVEYGGELIWAVGYTSGGAPFGMLASELEPVDLAALGRP